MATADCLEMYGRICLDVVKEIISRRWLHMSFDLDQYEEAHRSNWANFVKLTAYGATGIILLLVLLAIFVL